MIEKDARRLAEDLMRSHGLLDRNFITGTWASGSLVCFGPWKFVIDRHTRDRAGHCRYRRREIGVSAWLIKYNEEPRVRNTILHEIAHALTPGHHHDRVWRAKALKIGNDGLRCYDAGAVLPLVRPPMNFNGVCPVGHEHDRQRRPRVDLGCWRCSSKWSPDVIVTWTDNKTGERATCWRVVRDDVRVFSAPVDTIPGGA